MFSVNEYAAEISDVNWSKNNCSRYLFEQYEAFIRKIFHWLKYFNQKLSKKICINWFQIAPGIVFDSNWHHIPTPSPISKLILTYFDKKNNAYCFKNSMIYPVYRLFTFQNY